MVGKTSFVSLFCGTCSVESQVKAEKVILNDAHPYLISCLQEFQSGREYPDFISEEEYKDIKINLDRDKALSGFVGFGCSFGAKWWGGYARQKKGLNYAVTAKNSLKRKFATLTAAKILNRDYRSVEIPDDSVVYCDPPYEGTTKYSNSKEFDHVEFWQYIRELSKTNLVFVSELKAPEDFKVVWSKDFTRNLDANTVFVSSEKLFIHKSNYDKIQICSES